MMGMGTMSPSILGVFKQRNVLIKDILQSCRIARGGGRGRTESGAQPTTVASVTSGMKYIDDDDRRDSPTIAQVLWKFFGMHLHARVHRPGRETNALLVAIDGVPYFSACK